MVTSIKKKKKRKRKKERKKEKKKERKKKPDYLRDGSFNMMSLES